MEGSMIEGLMNFILNYYVVIIFRLPNIQKSISVTIYC